MEQLPVRFNPADLARSGRATRTTLPVSHFSRFAAILADESGDVDIEIASIGTQWDQAELQCLTKYFIDEMMDLMFADPGTAFPAPAATYVSLHTATSFTGANEFTDPAYSRQLPTLGSTAIVSGNARVQRPLTLHGLTR